MFWNRLENFINYTIIHWYIIVIIGGLMINSVLCVEAADVTFSQTESYCPIKISYDQLTTLINRIRSVTTKANENENNSYLSEKLTLRYGYREIEFENNFTLDNLLHGPKKATYVKFYYSNKSDKPISRILLQLGDYKRELKVSGTSNEQVDALVSLISRDLEYIGCSFGGHNFRFICGVILIITATILAFLPLFKIIQPILWLIFCAPIILGIYIMVYFISWENILPGTKLLASDVSFFELNSGLFSVIALIVTLLTTLITGWGLFRNKTINIEDNSD